MDYRSFYEDITAEPIPDGFDIHHLDGNRDNNKIRNLLALPRELHQRFHSFYHKIPETIEVKYLPTMVDMYGGDIIECLRVSRDISEWIGLRNHLLFKNGMIGQFTQTINPYSDISYSDFIKKFDNDII